jgi:hypothetical protein
MWLCFWNKFFDREISAIDAFMRILALSQIYHYLTRLPANLAAIFIEQPRYKDVFISIFDFIPVFQSKVLAIGIYFSILIGLFLIFSNKLKRIGSGLAALGTLTNIVVCYGSAGVSAHHFNLFPLLAYAFLKKNEGDNKNLIDWSIGILSGMYFFSAFNKLNLVFLSGQTIAIPFVDSYVWPEYLKIIVSNPPLRIFAAISIVLLQFAASLMFYKRMLLLAYFSALSFHFFTALFVKDTFLIFIGAAGLPFLLGFKWADRRYYRFICVFAFVAFLFQQFSNFIFIKKDFEYALSSSSNAIVSFILMASWLFFHIRHTRGHLIAIASRRVGKFFLHGIAISSLYFLSCRIWAAPVPFGYTQYSGQYAQKEKYGFSVKYSKGSSILDAKRRLSIRWNIVFLESSEKGIREFSMVTYSRKSREKIISFFCGLDEAAQFRLFEVTHKNKASQDYTDHPNYHDIVLDYLKDKTSGVDVKTCKDFRSFSSNPSIQLHFMLP